MLSEVFESFIILSTKYLKTRTEDIFTRSNKHETFYILLKP